MFKKEENQFDICLFNSNEELEPVVSLNPDFGYDENDDLE